MLKKISFYILLILSQFSCSTSTNEIPDVAVDIYISLGTTQELEILNGWTIVEGGIKGILVYNVGNYKFKAYELNCPHISPNDCSRLEIQKDGITVKCDCDNSTFLLITGEPLTGSAFPLKEYYVSYDPTFNTIRITN